MPFTTPAAFRATSFAPRESVDLRTLTSAVEHFEALTGGEVDVEESAIASAVKGFADEELRMLLPLEARAQANNLPVLSEMRDYRSNLETIQAADSDDCVRILSGEGKSLKSSRDQVRKIRQALVENGSGLATVRKARLAVHQVWPVLKGRAEGAALEESLAALIEGLASPTFYEQLSEISTKAIAFLDAHKQLYEKVHDERATKFASAVDFVRGHQEWTVLTEETQGTLIAPLASRACDTLQIDADGVLCTACRATVGQIESDIAALSGLRSGVLARLQELATPEQKVERVRLAEYFALALTDHNSVDQAIELLREHLYKLVDEQSRIVLE